MQTCECGAEKITFAVCHKDNYIGGRPVVLHFEDYKRYGGARLVLHTHGDLDYVKKEDGSRFGLNVGREILGLDPGHQGMTKDEEIVTYLNGNTLDLRRCNLAVVSAGEQNRRRAGKKVVEV